MTVTLGTRHDLTLPAFRRVAWEGEPVALGPEVPARLATTRAAFLSLLEDESATVYGVTSGFGDRATLRLTPEERAEQAREASDRGVSFGEALPERVTRGIVFARLANLVGGHGAVRPQVAEAVAGMLGGGDLPRVPSQGNGGSGEILALGHLFDLLGRITRLVLDIGRSADPAEELAVGASFDELPRLHRRRHRRRHQGEGCNCKKDLHFLLPVLRDSLCHDLAPGLAQMQR